MGYADYTGWYEAARGYLANCDYSCNVTTSRIAQNTRHRVRVTCYGSTATDYNRVMQAHYGGHRIEVWDKQTEEWVDVTREDGPWHKMLEKEMARAAEEDERLRRNRERAKKAAATRKANQERARIERLRAQ